jgi:hypothetical protein
MLLMSGLEGAGATAIPTAQAMAPAIRVFRRSTTHAVAYINYHRAAFADLVVRRVTNAGGVISEIGRLVVSGVNVGLDGSGASAGAGIGTWVA